MAFFDYFHGFCKAHVCCKDVVGRDFVNTGYSLVFFIFDCIANIFTMK